MDDFFLSIWAAILGGIILGCVLLLTYSAYWGMETFRWFVREYANRTDVMAKSAGLVEVKES